MTVSAGLHLPGFVGFFVEKVCEFLIERTGVRFERFKFIFILHESGLSSLEFLLKHKMGMGDVKKARRVKDGPGP